MKGEQTYAAPSFKELYEEFSHDWQTKARNLQSRRWQALKRDTKGSTNRY
jgi:hypothetical protein